MSRMVIAAVAGSAAVAGLLAWARARPSATAPRNIPVDEELNVKPYKVEDSLESAAGAPTGFGDKPRAVVSTDTTYGQVPTSSLVSRPVGTGELQQVPTERTVATRQETEGGFLPSSWLRSLKSGSKRQQTLVAEEFDASTASNITWKADAEHKKALTEQQRAQEAAAKASAAVAAAELLKEKELEAQQRYEQEMRLAKDMEEAARAKRDAAKEASRLFKKEHKYLVEAETEAERRLREQEAAMKAAAMHEEAARKQEMIAEQERLRVLAAREEEAQRRLRAAQAMEQVEQDRIAKEQAAIDEARNRAAREAAEARDRQLAAERARESAARAARMEAEMQRDLAALRERADKLRAERAEAERQARQLSSGPSSEARLAALQREIAAHEDAAAKAAAALERARADERAAGEQLQRTASVADKVRSWWNRSSTNVTAVAASQGKAVSEPMVDTTASGRSREGIRVTASGAANVVLQDTTAPAKGGRLRADIDAHLDSKDEASSRVSMAESGRSLDLAPAAARASSKP